MHLWDTTIPCFRIAQFVVKFHQFTIWTLAAVLATITIEVVFTPSSLDCVMYHMLGLGTCTVVFVWLKFCCCLVTCLQMHRLTFEPIIIGHNSFS